MKGSDVNWFRPLWRRVLVTVLVAGWCLWEVLVSGDQLWMLLTGALLAYAIYNFFYAFPKENGDGS